MELRLNLSYHMKSEDRFGFLEQHETAEINKLIVAAMEGQTLVSNEARQLFAYQQRLKAFEELGYDVASRATGFLLRSAMELKYKTDRGPVIPRKAEGKTMPGKWWGDIAMALEEHPDTLDLSVQIMTWLVAVWQDEKVQNGFGSQVQAWVNVLDAEMERIADLLADNKAEVKAG